MKASHQVAQSTPLVQEVTTCNPSAYLTHLQRFAYLGFLDSASRSPDLGRYSYLACDPFGLFRVEGGLPFWNDTPLRASPFAALQSLLERHKTQSLAPHMPPFQGGAFGYLSYEAGRLLEILPDTSHEEDPLPEILLPFYDVILAIDHFSNGTGTDEAPRAFIISTGHPETGRAQQQRAHDRLDWFQSELETASRSDPPCHVPPPIRNWRSNFSRKEFSEAVEKTRQYIFEGDIFQANITQCFSAQLPDTSSATPLAYYQKLRETNAAPFAAYLDCGDHVIASSSPERFVTLSEDGQVQTRPIKGTAQRDLKDAERDRILAAQLLESGKDRAENVMITDLMRNDLSRICKPGSIKVPDLCGLESYARVHHLVSTVTGQLKQGLGPVALLGACFPGGSITGAPKIRAMEVITELEDRPRGVYCGSIGYIGFNGAMDTNIAIRTVTFRHDQVHFSAGGGMTILSDPSDEYEECLHKASAIFRSFGTSVEMEREGLETPSPARNGTEPKS